MTGHYAAWMPAMGSGTGTPRSLPVLLSRSARRQDSPVRFRAVTIVLATVLLLAGCTRGGSVPTPPPGEETADRAAAELAAGLGKKDVSTPEFDSIGLSRACQRRGRTKRQHTWSTRPDGGNPAGNPASFSPTWTDPTG